MPSEFLLDYTLWVFLSALGVVQFVAARSGLLGLLFFRRRRRATLLLAPAWVVGAFTWYFASDFRNHPDTTLGLDANEQALWFALGSAVALALTLAVSSAVNHRWGGGHGWDASSGGAPPIGLTWLERTTFARALAARLAALRSRERRVPFRGH